MDRITPAEYGLARKHGYAGPLSELGEETRQAWAELIKAGATHWQLQHSGRGTVLALVIVEGIKS